MEIEQVLQEVGMSEKEAKIYITLLQLGKSTAYQVSKHSDIKKSTAYVTLENLFLKGNVHKQSRGKILKYSAIEPKVFLEKIQEKTEILKKALPEITALQKSPHHKVTAQYFEGIGEIREMFNQLLQKTKGQTYHAFYAHIEDTSQELFELFEEINIRHELSHISRKIITVDDPKLRSTFYTNGPRKLKNVQVKMLPKEQYNSSISIEIYEEFTQIFSHKYLQGIVLENPDIANTMRQVFELVWESSTKKNS